MPRVYHIPRFLLKEYMVSPAASEICFNSRLRVFLFVQSLIYRKVYAARFFYNSSIIKQISSWILYEYTASKNIFDGATG